MSTSTSCPQFNLRELSAVAMGLCRMTPVAFREPLIAVRLWVHECERVLGDRLVSEVDQAQFQEMRVAATRKYFEDFKQVRRGWAGAGTTQVLPAWLVPEASLHPQSIRYSLTSRPVPCCSTALW